MKILLCNEAYIGDLILSTSVLPVLKQAYPQCKIGFLVGSWAKTVVEDHPLVEWIHLHDQICFNRALLPKRKKREQEIATRRVALKEVINIGYDCAIDLHSYYEENSAYLLHKAAIPQRIAYFGGKKPFLSTELLFWNCRPLHVLENHRKMLQELGIPTTPLTPCLEYSAFPSPPSLPKEYIAIHMGTGDPTREWPLSYWRTLSHQLDQIGLPLLFLGKGPREAHMVSEVTLGLKNALNFANQLEWKQLLQVIKQAKFLLGIESMAGHLAATYQTEALLLYAGPSSMDWRPHHSCCKVLMPKKTIQDILPEEVYEELPLFMKN